jgi:hypothetical protein
VTSHRGARARRASGRPPPSASESTRAFPRPRAPRSRAPNRPGGSCPWRVAPCDVRAEPLVLVCAARAQAAYKSHWLLVARTCLLHLALSRNRLPYHPGPSRPPAPLEAAAVNPGSGRPHYPTEAPSTSSCTYYSSPACSLSPRSRHLAGASSPAAAAGRHRQAPMPEPPRSFLWPQTNPW